jgi:hypothetical protein
MELKKMAAVYRESGEKCHRRLSELEVMLASRPMCNTERLRLRREICLLACMARDAIAISNYLENYYERKDVYEQGERLDARPGISGAEAIYQAGRFLCNGQSCPEDRGRREA